MYERIKKLYLDYRLSNVELDKAVEKGWLTEEQANSLKEERQKNVFEDLHNQYHADQITAVELAEKVKEGEITFDQYEEITSA